jgi:5-methylcytosine-specific restriction endonuclease McrA
LTSEEPSSSRSSESQPLSLTSPDIQVDVRPLAVPQEASAIHSTNAHESNVVASFEVAPMGAPLRRDRRTYFALRRIQLHRKALRVVADFYGRKIECFKCLATDHAALQLDHIDYSEDSVIASHAAERSREAIAAPWRFRLLCRRCHQWRHNRRHAEPSRKRAVARLEGSVIVIPLVLTINGN